jgi:hypothetical protein
MFLGEKKMNYEYIAEEIIGLGIKEGAKIVRDYGLKFRVAVSNGINLGSPDPDMVNVEINNNEITKVIFIGEL